MTREQIDDYIKDKTNWSNSTKLTVRSKLYTLSDLGFEPARCFAYLDSRNYSRYAIKTYFILAGQVKSEFSRFLKDNASLFRNAYQDKTDVISHKQLMHLLAEATEISSHTYNLLYLMAFCGLRLSEAQSVKYGDIKEGSYLELLGKGRKFRQIPINTDKLFSPTTPSPEAFIAGPVNPRRLLSRYNITPHSLRAFYITNMVRSKILDMDEVQKVVGHSSLLTTQRYLRTSINDMVAKVKESGI